MVIFRIIFVLAMAMGFLTLRAVETVTNNDDAGAGSLRQAVIDASAGEEIVFDGGVTGTITLTGGEIAIAKDLIITGPGASVLAVSGNDASRIFNISGSDVDVTISGLTITSGLHSSTAATGGGIFNSADGLVTIEDCIIEDCEARASTSVARGGGIYNAGVRTAAGAGSSQLFTIRNCIIRNNLANPLTSGQEARGGGVINISTGALTAWMVIENSAIYGNDALGAGTNEQGGGIFIDAPSDMTITNTTISGNSSSHSGGINGAGTITLDFVTISGNSLVGAGNGGGGAGTFTTVTNSIIAGNTDTGGADDVGSTTITNLQNSCIGNDTGLTITNDLGGNLLDTDPLLDVLTNVSATWVHPLDDSSPAYNAADCGSITEDQRGLARPQADTCDMGAYEFEVAGIDPTAWYVDNAASGANDGTSWTDAWEELNLIDWADVTAGDTVFISGGSTSKNYATVLDLNSEDGGPGNRTVITKGLDSGHTGTVIIDGPADSTTFSIDMTGCLWIKVANISTNRGFVNMNAAGHSILENCIINTYITGVDVATPTNRNEILNNTVTVTSNDLNGPKAISITSNDSTVVDGNIITAINLDGGLTEYAVYVDGQTDLHLTNNAIETIGVGNQSIAVYANNLDGNDNKMYNNVIISGTTETADTLVKIILTNSSQKLYFYNNSLAGDVRGVLSLKNAAGASVKNNIFFSETASATAVRLSAAIDADSLNYNNYFLSGGGYYGATSSTNYTFAAWQALGYEAKGVKQDPNFTNYAGQDLSLAFPSPAADAGATLPALYEDDIDGNARDGQCGYWDMGAYEFLWVIPCE
jgi:hypothetical protein